MFGSRGTAASGRMPVPVPVADAGASVIASWSPAAVREWGQRNGFKKATLEKLARMSVRLLARAAERTLKDAGVDLADISRVLAAIAAVNAPAAAVQPPPSRPARFAAPASPFTAAALDVSSWCVHLRVCVMSVELF